MKECAREGGERESEREKVEEGRNKGTSKKFHIGKDDIRECFVRNTR